MSKPTLEQLAPYLPYGLKVKLNDTGIFNLDSEYGTPYQAKLPLTITDFNYSNSELEINAESDHNWGVGYAPIEEFDFLLRPMSDLTKKLKIEGEEKIPIVELAKIAYSDIIDENTRFNVNDNLKAVDIVSNSHPDIWFCCSDKWEFLTLQGQVANQLELYKWLFKHKFDVFNGIGTWAIDVNTLTENIY